MAAAHCWSWTTARSSTSGTKALPTNGALVRLPPYNPSKPFLVLEFCTESAKLKLEVVGLRRCAGHAEPGVPGGGEQRLLLPGVPTAVGEALGLARQLCAPTRFVVLTS